MKARSTLFFLCLLLCACASPEKDWQLASRDDSPNAYLEFLAKHPNSEFADQARQRIEELRVIRAWERAEFKDTLAAYQAFIEKFSDSEYTPEARERIDGFLRDARWDEIRDGRDRTAFEAFIAKYPAAPQLADAQLALNAIIEAEAAAQPAPPLVRERTGDFRLQLAAFRSIAAAERELRRLVALAPDVLTEPVRLETPEQHGGSKYLLKTVPMSWSEAQDACTALKRLGQDCIVINR